MPVGPEDAVGFDVQVHRINANAGIALEGLLIAPVGHARVQAADFIVVGYVENLPTAVHAWKKRLKSHKDAFEIHFFHDLYVLKSSLKEQAAYKRDTGLVLTVSLAGVIDPGKVLVAAAFVGPFGVVADVGTHSELQTLIFI